MTAKIPEYAHPKKKSTLIKKKKELGFKPYTNVVSIGCCFKVKQKLI